MVIILDGYFISRRLLNKRRGIHKVFDREILSGLCMVIVQMKSISQGG